MRVILTFYRIFAIPFIAITLVGCLMIWFSGSGYFAIRVFWMKLITDSLFVLYFILFRAHQFYFFHNLGFSRKQLLTFVLLFDFVIWLILTMITVQLL